MFDRHKILKAHYRAEIEKWDWAGIIMDCVENVIEDDEGQQVGCAWLGTVQGLTPS